MKRLKNRLTVVLCCICLGTGVLRGQGFDISPDGGLLTTEFGVSDTVRIKLTSQPASDVTLGVSVSDTTEGSVNINQLIFTSADWDTDQTVILTGTNDDLHDGDIEYSLILSAAVSNDAGYDSLDPSDLAATNFDDDRVAVEVFPTGGIIVSERGNDAVISVRLDSKPESDVFLGFASSDETEGIISTSLLEFSPENWSTIQQVTVTGVSDTVSDGDQVFTVTFFEAASTDENYNGLDPPDVTVTNMNVDAPGIHIYPTTGLTTSEIGDEASFTMMLLSRPTSDVTVALTVSDLTEASLAASSVTFTSDNWDKGQRVSIAGQDDFDDDGDQNFTVITAASSSEDTLYDGIDPADVSVTNVDDDGVGFIFYPIDTLSTSEDGGSSQFTILLTSQPASPVIVPVVSSDESEGSVMPAWAMFKENNWSNPQRITVSGVNDDFDDDDIRYSLLIGPAESADPNYDGIDPVDFFVTNRDNDSAYVIVTPTSGLLTTETGGKDTLTFTLSAQPRKDVLIPLSPSEVSEGSVSPDTVRISPDQWQDDFTAVVTGVDDTDLDGDQTYSLIIGPVVSDDYSFAGIDPADVEVTNLDREALMVIFPTTVDFDSVQIDTSSVVSITVSNAGNHTLTITQLSFSSTNFVAGPEQVTVHSGDSANIDITFTPDTVGNYLDTLLFENNAYQENLKLPVSGIGVDIDNVKPAVAAVAHTPEQPATGNDVTVSCTATDVNGIREVKLVYLIGGSTVERQLAMASSSGSSYETVIPADDVTMNGVIYTITALDNRYNTAKSGPHSVSITFSSGELTSVMSGAALSGGLEMDSWQMFSIPTHIDENDPQEVLKDEIGKRTKKRWELWQWLDDKWKFPDEIEPGKGYWLIQWVKSSMTINPGSGKTVDHTGFTFNVQPGWNMIGNPYPFTVTLNLDESKFYGPISYNQGWSSTVQQIQPWGGYAVYNKGAAPETVTLNPTETDSGLARNNVTLSDGWKLNMAAYGETYFDLDNAIGRLSGSSEELDYRDNPEPPYLGGHVSLVMHRKEWNTGILHFPSDIRSLEETEGVWDVELRVIKETSPVTLSFNMEGDFPGDHSIVLLDLTKRETLSLEQISSLTINQNWDKLIVYPFKVIAGSPEYVSSMTQEILSQLPETFTLHQNYPNPFNPTTTIRFEVPMPSRVTLKIYNLMGQEVTALTDNWFHIGSHSVVWNGKDHRGRLVGSGVYFYTIQAGEFMESRKMILLR